MNTKYSTTDSQLTEKTTMHHVTINGHIIASSSNKRAISHIKDWFEVNDIDNIDKYKEMPWAERRAFIFATMMEIPNFNGDL